MSATNSKRELWVDYIKAIACLSVLTFHVIYGLQNAGLECYPVLAVIKDFCTIFQIPTFMIASGYLFSKKPIGNYFKFEARKLLNLGVPFVVFTSVYYFINSAAGSMVNFQSDRKSLIDCLILTPIAQYWYIFATIIIFIFLPIVEKVFKNEGIILLILLSWKLVNWYQISFCGYDYYFAQYAFYFYIGVLYGRHKDIFEVCKESISSVVALAAVMIALFVSDYCIDWQVRGVIQMVIAVIMVYLLIYFFGRYEDILGNKFLKVVAKYSFQIYLMHTMVTAATRILLVKIGIVNSGLQFVIGWIVGLAVTMFVAWFCERTVILNIFFFPERTVKKLRKK